MLPVIKRKFPNQPSVLFGPPALVEIPILAI